MGFGSAAVTRDDSLDRAHYKYCANDGASESGPPRRDSDVLQVLAFRVHAVMVELVTVDE